MIKHIRKILDLFKQEDLHRPVRVPVKEVEVEKECCGKCDKPIKPAKKVAKKTTSSIAKEMKQTEKDAKKSLKKKAK
jgi:hypothetical protein